jgi:hypothetical protein
LDGREEADSLLSQLGDIEGKGCELASAAYEGVHRGPRMGTTTNYNYLISAVSVCLSVFCTECQFHWPRTGGV